MYKEEEEEDTDKDHNDSNTKYKEEYIMAEIEEEIEAKQFNYKDYECIVFVQKYILCNLQDRKGFHPAGSC